MTRAPLLHAMFHRQDWEDESLLRLAQERFHAADPSRRLRSLSRSQG